MIGIGHLSSSGVFPPPLEADLQQTTFPQSGNIAGAASLPGSNLHPQPEDRAGRTFESFDLDGNGIIDSKEFDQMAAQLQEKMMSILNQHKVQIENSLPPQSTVDPEEVLTGLVDEIHEQAKELGGGQLLEMILTQLQEQSIPYTTQGTADPPKVPFLSLVDEVA